MLNFDPKEKEQLRSITHGFTRGGNKGRHRMYKIWIGVTSRCNREKDKAYKRYGGKGIKLLWQSFNDFKNDMFESYEEHVKLHGEKQTTLDRIDSNGHYCKENCRRSTYKVQENNRSNNVGFNRRCIYRCKEMLIRDLLSKRPQYDIDGLLPKRYRNLKKI